MAAPSYVSGSAKTGEVTIASSVASIPYQTSPKPTPGNTLICYVTQYRTYQFSVAWSDPWIEVKNYWEEPNTRDHWVSIAVRKVRGDETGTFTINTRGGAGIVMYGMIEVEGAVDPEVLAPAVSHVTTAGAAGNPDPPKLYFPAAAGITVDALVIAGAWWFQNSAAGATPPTGYTERFDYRGVDVSVWNNHITMATKEVTAVDNEDPGAFTLDSGNLGSSAFTIVLYEAGTEPPGLTVRDKATDGGAYGGSHVIDLPTKVAPRDTLVLEVAWGYYGGGNNPATPAGWTLVADYYTTPNRCCIYTKRADGSEAGGTVTITGITSSFASICRAVPDAHLAMIFCPRITGGNSSTGTSPAPGNCDWEWGADAPTLLIVGAMWLDVTTDVSGYPSGYSDGVQSEYDDVTYDVVIADAYKTGIMAGSENSGAFSISASETWLSWGIALAHKDHVIEPYIVGQAISYQDTATGGTMLHDPVKADLDGSCLQPGDVAVAVLWTDYGGTPDIFSYLTSDTQKYMVTPFDDRIGFYEGSGDLYVTGDSADKRMFLCVFVADEDFQGGAYDNWPWYSVQSALDSACVVTVYRGAAPAIQLGVGAHKSGTADTYTPNTFYPVAGSTKDRPYMYHNVGAWLTSSVTLDPGQYVAYRYTGASQVDDADVGRMVSAHRWALSDFNPTMIVNMSSSVTYYTNTYAVFAKSTDVPLVRGWRKSNTVTAASSLELDLPYEVQDGNLLLFLVGSHPHMVRPLGPGFGWPSSVVPFFDNPGWDGLGATVSWSAAFTYAGSHLGDGDTLTVTMEGSGDIFGIVLEFINASGVPVFNYARASSGSIDPPSLTPASGAVDAQNFVAAGVIDADDILLLSDGYSPGGWRTSGGAAHNVGFCSRPSANATEDPGAWSTLSDDWIGMTIAIPGPGYPKPVQFVFDEDADVTLPKTIDDDDLIVVWAGGASSLTQPSGYDAEDHNQTVYAAPNYLYWSLYKKWANGDGEATLTVTNATRVTVLIVKDGSYRIWDTGQSNVSFSDPPAVSPAPKSVKYLVIGGVIGRNTTSSAGRSPYTVDESPGWGTWMGFEPGTTGEANVGLDLAAIDNRDVAWLDPPDQDWWETLQISHTWLIAYQPQTAARPAVTQAAKPFGMLPAAVLSARRAREV